MGEPSGLPSMGSHRVGHDWSDLAAAAAAATPFSIICRNFVYSLNAHTLLYSQCFPIFGLCAAPWSFMLWNAPVFPCMVCALVLNLVLKMSRFFFSVLRSLIWIKYLDLIFAYAMKQRSNFSFSSCWEYPFSLTDNISSVLYPGGYSKYLTTWMMTSLFLLLLLISIHVFYFLMSFTTSLTISLFSFFQRISFWFCVLSKCLIN